MTCRLRNLLQATVTLLALACGGDETPFSPTVANVAGTYNATTLTVTENGVTTNLLAAGTTVALTLNQDGSTSGRLFAPGQAEDGGDFEADLAGTWALAADTVTFDQPGADTFLRDIPFTATRNRLRGEGTFGEITIRVILTK